MSHTLPLLLQDAARRWADRAAVASGDAGMTYAQLATGAERLAGRLHELGLAGSRVGILMPNLPTFPLAFGGVLRAGGSVLLLNPMNSPRETEEYLLDAEVKAVLTTTALLGLLPKGVRALLADALPEALQVESEREDHRLPLDGAPAAPALHGGPDAEAAIIFTAAHEGRARGAVLSHGNLVANLRSTIRAMRLTERDRVLAALPFVHAFGLTVCLNAVLAAGATLVPMDRFHPLRALELLESAGITVLLGVPAMFQGLLAAAERRAAPAHALRIAISGGAPLPADVARRWQAGFGLPLRQGYGLTEAGPVCLFNRVDRPNRPGTLGYPYPDVEVVIRAPNGGELPAGEVGEICVRGDNVFQGYLGEGGRNPRDFHGDWLRTGDLGSMDEHGSVRFRGLVKPMFTRNGFNVYPRELERVLEADERVAQATVCALPDPLRENEIVLLLRRAPGAVLGEDDVRDLCRAKLASYKQPGRVEITG